MTPVLEFFIELRGGIGCTHFKRKNSTQDRATISAKARYFTVTPRIQFPRTARVYRFTFAEENLIGPH